MIKHHCREQKKWDGASRGRLESIGAVPSSPPRRRGDLLRRNHDLCQRKVGCQAEQGMKVWADNDKCSLCSHRSSSPSATHLCGWGWSSSALEHWRLFLSFLFCAPLFVPPGGYCPHLLHHLFAVMWPADWVLLLPVPVLMVMEAKQSPLSWCSAIRLCQTLWVHASRQEEEAGKRGRERSDILDGKRQSRCSASTNIVSLIGIADESWRWESVVLWILK